jgi:hypothetical protein
MASSTLSSFANSRLLISPLILAASASVDDEQEELRHECQSWTCSETPERATMAMVVAANATASRANDVVECNDGVDEREHEQEGCCNESYELGSRWPGQSFLLLLLLGPGYYTIQCVRQ